MFSFVKRRPPLIVFVLCLLTMTITVFCFAFYIKNTDPVPDTDKNHDWITLLKHFSSLDTCLQLNFSSKQTSENDFIETSKVQALVSINNTDLFKKINSVKGFLVLDKWQTNCPKRYTKPSHFLIYFDIPEMAKTNSSKFDVCVTIEGPEEYLPKFSKPNCQILSTNDKKVDTFLTSIKSRDRDFCKNGQLGKLVFHLQNKDNFANFLSENEKSLIYVHLLWTSYFLVFLLLIIVIYGTFQSEQVFDKYLHKLNPRS